MPPTKEIVRARYHSSHDASQTQAGALERALTAMGVASWRYDALTRVLSSAGTQLTTLLGGSASDAGEASGLWIPSVHPADRSWLVAYRELMLRDPLSTGYECSYRTLLPDGRERWMREVAQIERDARQQPTLIVGILDNITDRREQEEKRAEGAERFRAAFEDAFTGIAMVGLDGSYLEVNREFALITGETVLALLEKHVSDFAHPEDAPSGIASTDGAMIDGALTMLERSERRYLRSDGDVRWVIERASLIYDAEARPSYYIVQALDITDRRNAESSLKSTEAQLLQAQKMEALGQLAGGVAHDFNNLLTVIKSYSQMVLGTMETADPNHEDLLEVVGAADRAAGLTRQLLAFSRKQSQHWQSLRVNDVVTETEKMLRRLIGSTAELIVEIDPDVGEVDADKGQLEQIIMNLVVNARDAMPHGGRISITTRSVELEQPLVDAIPSVVPAGSYAMLDVSDAGTGMDRATIARIFEPFFTTKAAGHGTGLGLSTVYGIVQQFGGFLVVTSTVGEGSHFHVYLPRRTEESLHSDADAQHQIPTGTETVLVIEDDDAVRTLTRHILVRLGYSVLAARDAKEALQLAAGFDQEIQLLLCDVQLPGVSGYRAAELLRAARPDACALFMSGHMDVSPYPGEESAMVAELQQHELLTKPFSIEQLAHAVRTALATSEVST